MRAQLCTLYLRFYGALVAGLIIVYHLQAYLHIIIFAFYSFWIPQIVENCYHNQRATLHVHYIAGISITRLAIPLYLYGCPNKFVHLKENYTVCVLLVLYVSIQAGLLTWQSLSGGRVFIPAHLQPERYSYSRLPPAQLASEDCSICMSRVEDPQNCMVTPCDHVFHTACLQQWMDLKLECPVCRRELPPYET